MRHPLRVGRTGLVQPVEPEEIGHARQARTGAEYVASHPLDSIAVRARCSAPRQSPKAARSRMIASICAISET